ncbi:unnamed protein product [Scytosiphon promiscuus]
MKAPSSGALLLLSAIALREATSESIASRLQITIPNDLYREDGYPHEEALFGIPKYGGTIAERLVHGGVSAGESKTWTLCSNEDEEAVPPMVPDGTPFILMVDRGECTFAHKVRKAQHLGAIGVIIADHTCLCSDEASGTCTKTEQVQCEQVEPIMADDGSGADILIPSFLMKKMDAAVIKTRLQAGASVQAEMTWSLPAPDDRVEWSLWTSAMDTSAAPFKRDFKEVVMTIGKSAQFTPYYVVYDGGSYGCTGSGAATCGSLCTNHGRYCMTDPDFDTKTGVSGADVVKESLRQKCVWKKYGGQDAPLKDQGIGEKWWAYVNEFFSSCSVAGNRFNDENCVATAMAAAGVDKDVVDRCMSDSGGTDGDNVNNILEKELEEKGSKSIVIVPTVFVNNVAERGGISSAAVLSTICAGYKSGTAPDVCRCAGQASSDMVYGCMTGTSPSGGGGGGMSAGNTLFLLLFVVGAMTAAGFVHYKRTQTQMRDQVRGILAEYMPLEDIDAPGSSARVPFMATDGGNTYAVGRTKESQLV